MGVCFEVKNLVLWAKSEILGFAIANNVIGKFDI
jgi:hypothetical protein